MKNSFFSSQAFLLTVSALISSGAWSVGVDQEALAFTLGGMANVKAEQKISLGNYKGKVV